MISLTAIQTTLTFSNARQLFFLLMKLLNLPAVVALPFSDYHRILMGPPGGQVIRYQPIRVVGGELYPEQFHRFGL